MPLRDIPPTLVEALGQSASDDFTRWMEDVLAETAAGRREWTEVSARLSGIDQDLDALKTDLADVKAHLAGVKTDLAGVKVDLAIVQSDMVAVNSALGEVRADTSDSTR